jgi:hypothetical protein
MGPDIIFKGNSKKKDKSKFKRNIFIKDSVKGDMVQFIFILFFI